MRALALASLVACGTPADTSLLQAREDLTTDALRGSLVHLASDELGGRGTGEPGVELAIAHVVEAFEAARLQPLPGEASFRLPFAIYREGWSPDCALAPLVDGVPVPANLGEQYRPFAFSDVGEVDAPLVFAGYGITAPELGWDDYADLDVRGKLVLVLRHDPGEAATDGPWKAHSGHALFDSKARNAADHGALGMILVTDPLNHAGADDLRADGRFSLESHGPKGPVAPPAPGAKERPEDQPFLAVHASRPLGEALVAPLGRDLAALQRALDGGERVQQALPGVSVGLALSRPEGRVASEAENVVAWLPGSDPSRAEELVVVGAHYDHLGRFEGEGDTTYNGADDNASGTAALLALARAFAALPPAARPRRPMVFAAFAAEEHGLLGSKALIASRLDPGDVAFMLNLDMVGRSQGKVQVVGDGYATGLTELVHVANAAERGGPALDLVLAGTDYAGNSDHHPFMEADVPFLFLHTGLHEDYHQLSDHADKIDVDGAARIARLAFGVLSPIASGDVTPGFVHHVGWLGVSIQPEDRSGAVRAVITRVEDGSRAAEAGFLVGDAIYGFNDEKLDEADAVGARFRQLTPGESARVSVDRANSRLTFTVQRAKTGYLGVWPADLTEEFRARHGLSGDTGLLLREVMREGPAAAAGLHDGDAVIAIAGVPTTLNTLSKTLTRIGAGEVVPITVIRDDQRLELTMTLGERPERP